MEDQKEVWNVLASGWYNWRAWPIRKVNSLAKEWKPGKVLDIGCGNGRNMLPFLKKGFKGVGLDFSKVMLENASSYLKKHKVQADLKLGIAEKLPFKDKSFDYCLFIASLHHINGKENQRKALLEMKRVLKNNGKALITVWNKLQKRFFFERKEIMVTWNTKGVIYERYYYLFNYWELKRLIKSVGLNLIESKGVFGKNLVFIVQK